MSDKAIAKDESNTDGKAQLMNVITSMIAKNQVGAGLNDKVTAYMVVKQGQELGLSPMYTLQNVNIIQGKPSLSANAIRALAYKNLNTLEITFVESNSKTCTVKIRRDKSDDYSTFTYTIEDAGLQGLTNKSNWKKMPMQMLIARCSTLAIRAIAPDAIAGFEYCTEEMLDVASPQEARSVSNDPISSNQLDEINDLIKETNTDVPKLLDYLKVQDLKELNESEARKAIHALMNKKSRA